MRKAALPDGKAASRAGELSHLRQLLGLVPASADKRSEGKDRLGQKLEESVPG